MRKYRIQETMDTAEEIEYNIIKTVEKENKRTNVKRVGNNTYSAIYKKLKAHNLGQILKKKINKDDSPTKIIRERKIISVY